MAFTLIANTGIHILPIKLRLDLRDKFRMWFHEWYDTTHGEWILGLAHEANAETS